MQGQQERSQRPERRWRLSAGEWVILLLNLLLAGASGFLAWFAFFFHLLPGPLPRENYLAGSAMLVVAVGAALTFLLLLLRQTRLAAWFQWLAALGVCALVVVMGLQWQQDDLLPSLVQLGILFLVLLLLSFSGRFLKHLGDDK